MSFPSIRSFYYHRKSLLCVCVFLMGALMVSPSHARPSSTASTVLEPQKSKTETVLFDLDMLKGRGIDPKLAEFFANAPRFRSGKHVITLVINGERRGQADASFDDDGQLIFDQTLLDKAQLVTPSSSFRTIEQQPKMTSYRFIEAFPGTIIQLKPGKDEVHLIVPTDALRPAVADTGNFSSGGIAALLNYNIIGMNSEFSSGSSEFRSVDTEAGFNAGDWIVRSRQAYISQDNGSRVEHLYTYGQRTFAELASTVQGGQINITNSIFPGDAITGIQIFPDAGLQRASQGGGATVDGIAYSTARVEVRQNNALIHTAVVPAGPFTLSNLSLLSSHSDVDVTVIEADGSRQTFSISAASLGGATLGSAPGFSFAAGQYRPYGDSHGKKPTLLTGTGTWKLNSDTNITAGLMGATDYQAVGWATDHALTEATTVGFRQIASKATTQADGNTRGTQLSASMSTLITDKLSIDLSATQGTEGFRDLIDTTYQSADFDMLNGRYQSQYTTSIGWSDKTLGGFRLSHAYSRLFDEGATQRLMGSWSKSFKHANVSLNVQKNIGQLGPYDQGDAVYLSVSVPIGKRMLRTYVNADSRRTRTGATFNEQVNDNFGYRVQAERDLSNRETDLSLMTNILPRYAQATLGYSRNGADTTTYNGSLSGGIVAHDQGVTFTPYAVDDTFGILSVGDISGVKISTPQGPVWTDYSGTAVAPTLQAYSNNRLEIEPSSLPRNIDLTNGLKEIQVGRGSVNRVDFGAAANRRVLLTARDIDGLPLVNGLVVVDAHKQYLSTVGDQGQVFLANLEPGNQLLVSLPNGKTCSLDYTLSDNVSKDRYFEAVDARCTPL